MMVSSVKKRLEWVKLVLNHIENFDKGKSKKEGEELIKELKKNYILIGFAPNITYVKHDGAKEDLKYQWVHPFGTPTLLYKHKKLPTLLLVNGNLDFNNSRLNKIDKNKSLELQSILGITG
jgi:hypothetical protein